jgi:transketolase
MEGQNYSVKERLEQLEALMGKYTAGGKDLCVAFSGGVDSSLILKAAVKAAYEHVGPVYLRFGRLAVPVINDTPDYKFEIGKGITLKEGTDVTIFATGLEVSESLEAAKMLEADGISAEVINIHTIKPLDEELVVASATKTGKVVTVEEHSIIGGLGSAVAEVLCEKAPTKMLRIGVNDKFGESGPAVELLHKYELDAEGIYKKVKAFCK